MDHTPGRGAIVARIVPFISPPSRSVRAMPKESTRKSKTWFARLCPRS